MGICRTTRLIIINFIFPRKHNSWKRTKGTLPKGTGGKVKNLAKLKKETRKQNFHGIVPGFLGGTSFMCFFSPIRNDPKKHINKVFAPTQSWDNPAHLFMFMCFFFP